MGVGDVGGSRAKSVLSAGSADALADAVPDVVLADPFADTGEPEHEPDREADMNQVEVDAPVVQLIEQRPSWSALVTSN